jgi:hypothetical protein
MSPVGLASSACSSFRTLRSSSRCWTSARSVSGRDVQFETKAGIIQIMSMVILETIHLSVPLNLWKFENVSTPRLDWMIIYFYLF